MTRNLIGNDERRQRWSNKLHHANERERMVKRLAKSDNVDRKQKWKKEKESANVENGVLEKLERLVIWE